MGNSLSNLKELGIGSEKNVLLGKAEQDNNEKNNVHIYLTKKNGDRDKFYCTIIDSNFYKNKEYAISIFNHTNKEEIKKELENYKNYQKYTPRLYDCIKDEKNDYDDGLNIQKDSGNYYFISDKCISLYEYLESKEINSNKEYFDDIKQIYNTITRFFKTIIFEHQNDNTDNLIFFDMKLDNLCYMDNEIKIIDFGNKYISTFEDYLYIIRDSEQDSIEMNKLKNIIEIFMNVIILYQIISIIFNKLMRLNINDSNKYKFISSIFLSNFIYELLNKNLSIKNLDEFIKFINVYSDRDNVIKKRINFYCTEKYYIILKNYEKLLKKQNNKKILNNLNKIENVLAKISIEGDDYSIVICELFKNYLKEFKYFKKAKTLSKRSTTKSKTRRKFFSEPAKSPIKI